jgi:hypothetical protein
LASWVLGFFPLRTLRLPAEYYPIGLYRPPRKNSTIGQMITGFGDNPVMLKFKSQPTSKRRMNSIIVIPQRSETLVSGQHEVPESAVKTLGKQLRLVAKDISARWSSGKLDDLLKRLLTVLSVIYFIGATCLAGLLLFKAFSA